MESWATLWAIISGIAAAALIVYTATEIIDENGEWARNGRAAAFAVVVVAYLVATCVLSGIAAVEFYDGTHDDQAEEMALPVRP